MRFSYFLATYFWRLFLEPSPCGEPLVRVLFYV